MLIPCFFLLLKMLRRNDSILNLDRPKIFVLPIFEVYGNQTVPNSKAELVSHPVLDYSFNTFDKKAK